MLDDVYASCAHSMPDAGAVARLRHFVGLGNLAIDAVAAVTCKDEALGRGAMPSSRTGIRVAPREVALPRLVGNENGWKSAVFRDGLHRQNIRRRMSILSRPKTVHPEHKQNCLIEIESRAQWRAISLVPAVEVGRVGLKMYARRVW